MAESFGTGNHLFVSMTRLMGVLSRPGVRFRAKESKRRLLCQRTPWLGFMVNTVEMRVGFGERKRQMALEICRGFLRK